jgi:hypothetical protein
MLEGVTTVRQCPALRQIPRITGQIHAGHNPKRKTRTERVCVGLRPAAEHYQKLKLIRVGSDAGWRGVLVRSRMRIPREGCNPQSPDLSFDSESRSEPLMRGMDILEVPGGPK